MAIAKHYAMSGVCTVLTASGFSVYCIVLGSKFLYPVLDGAAIGNRSVSASVKMSEHSSRGCHLVVILDKCLHGEPIVYSLAERYSTITFIPSPGPPEYYVNQNNEFHPTL